MDNGNKSHYIVSRDEFNEGMQEQVDNIMDVMRAVNALKDAVNKQAVALGLNRFVMEKFVPKPLLEQAVKEFKEMQEAIIEQESSGRPN